MGNPLDTQEGGGHYKDCPIQPVEYIHANGLGFIEGCVVKYITRFRQKNGLEDLLKIKHFIDLLIELEYKNDSNRTRTTSERVSSTCKSTLSSGLYPREDSN